MRLSHRGVSYEYTPPTLEVTEDEIQGRPREAPWKCYTLIEILVPQAPHAAVEQKGAYSRQDFSHIERSYGSWHQSQPSQTPAIDSTFDALQQLKRIHKANIDRSLERRMQVAKGRGDYQLLQALESELRETVLR